MIVMRPMDVSYRPKFKLDTALMDQILPNLTTLWIVAEQPIKTDYNYNSQTLEENTGEWIEWLTPVLACLGKTLSAECTVLADVNEKEDTSKLLHIIYRTAFDRCGQRRVNSYSKEGNFWKSLGIGMITTGLSTAETSTTTITIEHIWLE